MSKPLLFLSFETLAVAGLAGNPHLKMFNSTRHGYSIVKFTKTAARYSAFMVDKAQSGVIGNRTLIAVYETHAGTVRLEEKYRASPSGLAPLALAGMVRNLDPRREGVPLTPTAARAAGYTVARDMEDVGQALARGFAKSRASVLRTDL